METVRSFELLLPPMIPAVVGKEVNLYFDALICGEIHRVDVEISCAIGRHLQDRWTEVPEIPGQYPLHVMLVDADGTCLSAGETQVVVVDRKNGASVPGSAPRKLLCIGDSTTAAGHFTAELLRLAAVDQMPLALIGTRGQYPNVHEGMGGWKVESHFLSNESAFVFDGQFNFARYMEKHGFSGLTDVMIHLGINDMFRAAGEEGAQAVIEEEMPMLDKMITGIHAYDPAIRVGILLAIPPARSQDSFGYSYGTIQSRRIYRRKLHRWNAHLLQRYGSREDEGIHIVPIHINLDTLHSMPVRGETLHARSEQQVMRQCNAVHPSPTGYAQMADLLYYWLNVTG